MSAEDIHSVNFAKSTEDAGFVPPEDATWLDGQDIDNPYDGGIVRTNGDRYSLAAYDMVAPPADPENPPEEAATLTVMGRRVGRLSIRTEAEAPEVADEPTAGAELEVVTMDHDGNLVSSGIANELYKFQAEFNTPVAQGPDEIRAAIRDLSVQAARHAASRNVLAAPLSVYNPEPTHDDVNPHPYILHTNEIMSARTGFDTALVTRYGSVQFHTGTGRTEDMLQVISAQQLLVPILTAPSLSAPFMHGGEAERLGTVDWDGLTDEQRRHLDYTGLTPGDFRGRHHSFRPVLRGMASPEPNIHDIPAPDTVDDYLELVDKRLRDGDINTADRVFGMHRDRARVILDGSGANTIESTNHDTYLGNHEVISEMVILQNAVTARLEKMARSGEDPFDFLAGKLGIVATDRAGALREANAAYLQQTARHGNDANIYGRTPGEWADDLLAFTGLDEHDRTAEIVGKAFSSNRVAVDGLRGWAADNGRTGDDFRAAEAYYATGLGSPSVAMLEERRVQRGEPDTARLTPAEMTRRQELRIAEDFTAYGQRD